MVQLFNRRILIDGKPVLVFAGEIHYFRLKKAEWEDRIVKAKAMGCNAVASYIPWLIHEPRDGEFDLTGRFFPENNLGEFIDLCAKHGLWFIARPGPFIMAEMKNEGLPFWIYKKHPEIVPITWEGETARSATVDLLAPNFLKCAERWYAHVMPVLASRLQQKGGPVIGVQLDNEIGMLSWVNNQPELTESILCDFSAWLVTRFGHDGARERYPFDLQDPMVRDKALRDPKDPFAAAFLRDYGDYNRNRIARYVAALRSYAEASGVVDIPFIINIHGTGSGRGIPFPIGIHHLYEAFTQSPGYIAGTDHYLGEFRRENAADLYVINAFVEAVSRPEQPVTSMEFEAGTGDYGEQGTPRYGAATADFKARLSIAQGNRLLNYYLLTGGTNPPLLDPVGDGNDRAAFTGQRHGFAAPISPEGVLDPTYYGLKETTQRLMAVSHKLADMDEERDGIALTFVPDYYKTDFKRPGTMEQIVATKEAARGPLEQFSRVMMLLGFRFPAIDIQNRTLNPRTTPVIVLPSASIMDEAVQRKLLNYVRDGGGLFIFGDFPTRDLELKPCLVLAEGLGLKPKKTLEASGKYHLSLLGEGFAKDRPETRVWRALTFEEPASGVYLRVKGTGEACGVEVRVANGIASVLPANYPSHLPLFRTILERVGAKTAIRHDSPFDGILTLSQCNRAGERFVTMINLDTEDKTPLYTENGKPMFGGHRIRLDGRKALLLPVNVKVGAATIEFATTEIASMDEESVSFYQTRHTERVVLRAKSVKATGAKPLDGGRFEVTIRPGTGVVKVRLG